MTTSATNTANNPLQKAYMDISNSVNNLNRKITFYNIKTVIKTYTLFLASFAMGYLTAWAATILLGMTAGMFVAFPLAILGGLALGQYANQKMSKTLIKKGEDIDAAVKKSIAKYSHDINRAMHLDGYGCRHGWFPMTVQKIQLDSFKEVQKRYDNRPFINKWSPNFLRFA